MIKHPKNFGYTMTQLPKDLYTSLLKECNLAQEKNKELTTAISGTNTPKHYLIKDNLVALIQFVKKTVDEYDKAFPSLGDIAVLTKNVPFYIETPWVNFQKKHQFIPNHYHVGIYSYTIWMVIPYDIEEELKNSRISVMAMRCKHVAHLDCVAEHLKNNNFQGPICRKSIIDMTKIKNYKEVNTFLGSQRVVL